MPIFDVTVAILTYHPDVKKTLLTLESVLSQKAVSLEVLICDDGSEETYDAIWKTTFAQIEFRDYKIVNSPTNNGTVINCLNAAKKAQGKYLYLISPGDLLYEDTTLSKLFQAAEKGKYKICFGNAIKYQYDVDKAQYSFILKDYNPLYLGLYKDKRKKKLQKLDFFLEDYIIGASYFRDTQLAAKAFEMISETAKYMEDSTSSMLLLLLGEQIFYVEQNVVWYEYGEGISTNSKQHWVNLLDNDLLNTANKLQKQFHDPYLDYFLERRKRQYRGIGRIIRFLKHPLLFMMQITIKTNLKYLHKDADSKFDPELLKELLDNNYKKEFKICKS